LKTIAIIFIFLFSSFTKTSGPTIENVYGVWKGYYGTESEVNSITVKIYPKSKAEIVCNYADACITTSGTYKLLGDTAIVISCILTQEKSSEVVLHGNLNRTASFIDGQWGDSGKEKGCFYLQKLLPASGL
jgi:hypothetical protein